jgi:hypothetical protein
VSVSKSLRRARRGWILGTAGIALGGLFLAMGIGLYRLQGYLRERLPAYTREQLETALGRPVRFGSIHVSPFGTVAIDDVEVPPQAGEARAPLRARSLRAGLSWWDLLVSHRLRVSGIELQSPRVDTAVDLRTTPGTETSLNARILSLAAAGLRSIGVRDGEVRLAATLPDASTQVITAAGLSGSLDFTSRQFAYDARARRWDGGGVQLTGLRVRGDGDARETRLTQSDMAYQGGRLRARGTYQEAGQQLALTVGVHDFPLQEAARRMGMPGEWRLAGRVTGTLEMAADGGSLRRVRGLLVADAGDLRGAGMSREFVWNRASANLDWTQNGAQLQDIRVQGDGIELTGQASIDGSPAQIVSRGQFRAHGRVRVMSREAAARLGEILAYRSPLGGGWTAAGAEFEVDASGPAARPGDALATGRFRVADLALQPAGADAPLHVRTVSGEFRRDPAGLQIRSLVARASGIEGTGSLVVANHAGDQPVRFDAEGKVRIEDPQALHRLLPRAAMWRWLANDSPGTGEFTVRASGPMTELAAVQVEGRFDMRQVRLTLPGTGGGGSSPAAALAVRRAQGNFRHDRSVLRLSDVQLTGDEFEGRGEMAITGLHAADPDVELRVALAGTGWERLPGLGGPAARFLRGGRYTAHVEGRGSLESLACLPVKGDFHLTDARLSLPGETGEKRVSALSGRFAREDAGLRLSDVRLEAEGMSARGTVRIRSLAEADPQVEADVDASLAGWERLPGVTPALTSHMQGGRLAAQFRLAGPLSSLGAGPASGAIRLEGATLSWIAPDGKPAAQKVDTLAAEFRRSASEVRLSDLQLRGPGLRVDGSAGLSLPAAGRGMPGAAADPVVSIDARAEVNDWERLPGIPAQLCETIQGGRLAGRLKVTAPLSELSSAPATGDFRVEDARIALPDGRGGSRWLAARALAARFAREGERLRLTDLALEAEGLRAGGDLDIAALGDPHSAIQASLRIGVDGLERIPIGASPQQSRLRGGRLTAEVRGRGRVDALPAGEWSGSLRVEDARLLTASGATRQAGEAEGRSGGLSVRAFRSRFEHRGGRWSLADTTLDAGAFRVDGRGEIVDDGDRAGARAQFSGQLRSDDAGAVLNMLTPLPAVRGGNAVADLRLSASLSALQDAEVSGTLKAHGLRYQAPGTAEAVEVSRFETEFRRRGPLVDLQHLVVVLPGARLTGAGAIEGLGGTQSPTVDAAVRVTSDRWHELLGLGAGWDGVAGGQLKLDARLAGPLDRLAMDRGSFALEGAELRRGGASAAVPITLLKGSFQRAGDTTRLLGMELASPAGSATGDGELRGSGPAATHVFHVRWQADRPSSLLPMTAMPGRLDGGRLAGTVTIRGDGQDPVAEADGEFALSGAEYALPAAWAAGGRRAIPVEQLSGAFRKDGERIAVRNAQLASPMGSLRGDMEIVPGSGSVDLRATVEAADLGRLADYWPLTAGTVRGGSARAEIEVRSDGKDWSQTTGSARIEATGGRLILEKMNGKFSRATFSPLKARLAWDGSQVRIQSVELRGDKYNLDGSGSINQDGLIDVSGRAWLTRAFGNSMKPKGITGFLGRLFHMIPKQIETRFHLAGSVQRPTLEASIAHGKLWKFARKKLTSEVQRIALGNAPLWDLTALDDRRRNPGLDPRLVAAGDEDEDGSE